MTSRVSSIHSYVQWELSSIIAGTALIVSSVRAAGGRSEWGAPQDAAIILLKLMKRID